MKIDREALIREFGELAGAGETSEINWEIRGRRPEEEFHGPLERVPDIDVESECSE